MSSCIPGLHSTTSGVCSTLMDTPSTRTYQLTWERPEVCTINWSSGYDLCFRHATCPLLPAEDTSWNCAYSIKLSMDIWTSPLHRLYHETCPDLSETPSPWKATNTRMPISHHFSCIQLHFISIDLYKTVSHCVLWNTVLCHTSNISRNTKFIFIIKLANCYLCTLHYCQIIIEKKKTKLFRYSSLTCVLYWI